MPIEDIRMNIITNSKRVNSKLERCKWNDEEVIIASGLSISYERP